MRLLSEIRNYMGNYHLKSGVYHYDRNEFAQAVGFLRKALEDPELCNDDRAAARSFLARSLRDLGEKLSADGSVEAGIEELRRAAAVDASYPDIHFRLARLLERTGRPQEALDAYASAIACHPEYLEAHVALGNCLIDLGRADDAAAAFRRAVELRVARVERPFRQAMECLDGGRLEEARDWFREAFTSAPQLAAEQVERALGWLREDDAERALGCLDRSLALAPKFPDAHNLRGVALCRLERFEEACEAFRRSSELRPDHLVPRLNLAFTWLHAGRPAEAERELLDILQREPDQPVAAAKLAELRAARAADRPGSAARS